MDCGLLTTEIIYLLVAIYNLSLFIGQFTNTFFLHPELIADSFNLFLVSIFFILFLAPLLVFLGLLAKKKIAYKAVFVFGVIALLGFVLSIFQGRTDVVSLLIFLAAVALKIKKSGLATPLLMVLISVAFIATFAFLQNQQIQAKQILNGLTKVLPVKRSIQPAKYFSLLGNYDYISPATLLIGYDMVVSNNDNNSEKSYFLAKGFKQDQSDFHYTNDNTICIDRYLVPDHYIFCGVVDKNYEMKTDTWKTYNDPKLKLSFKYPPNFNLEVEDAHDDQSRLFTFRTPTGVNGDKDLSGFVVRMVNAQGRALAGMVIQPPKGAQEAVIPKGVNAPYRDFLVGNYICSFIHFQNKYTLPDGSDDINNYLAKIFETLEFKQ